MDGILEKIKNKKIIAIAAFLVISIVMLVLSILVAKCPIVAACIILVLEVAIAALLHNAELWVHGVFVIAEIIAGLLTGKILIIVLFLVVYIAATVALEFSK